MASILLSRWVNPTDPNPPNIPESDPRWVGLWWVGFFVSAALMVIFFSFMVSFPSHISTKRVKKVSKPVEPSESEVKTTPRQPEMLPSPRDDSISLSTNQSTIISSITTTNSEAFLTENATTDSTITLKDERSKCKIFFSKVTGNLMNKKKEAISIFKIF